MVSCLFKYKTANARATLHCELAAAQCIVIGPVCLWVGGYVCVEGLLP